MPCRPLILALCFVALFAPAVRAAESQKNISPGKNVLFLFSDDQRYDTIAALGNSEIHTPNLDKLASRSFVFTRAYCMGSMQGAVCVPSRAMLMSGRSLFHVGDDLKDIPLWPTTMAKAGYTTFFTGKWHNGRPSLARAFPQTPAAFLGGMSSHTKVPVESLREGKFEKLPQVATFSSTIFADEAVKFLKSLRADGADAGPKPPFFAYVAFTSPHDPRTPPEDYARRYDPAKLSLPKSFKPQHPFNNGDMTLRDEKLAPWPRTEAEIRRHTADYYGMITHLDHEVGRILAALEESGQAANTIVVFTSDHGLAVGRHGLLGKQNLYEHSMRPPLLVSGPGIAPGKSPALVYLYDLFPTIADLCGVELPPKVDGKSLAPILSGKADKVRDTVFLAYRDCQRAIRDDRWKLIRYPQINRSQLFDLENDPDELVDLSADPAQAERVAELMRKLTEAQRDAGDKLPLSTDKPAPEQIDLQREASQDKANPKKPNPDKPGE